MREWVSEIWEDTRTWVGLAIFCGGWVAWYFASVTYSEAMLISANSRVVCPPRCPNPPTQALWLGPSFGAVLLLATAFLVLRRPPGPVGKWDTSGTFAAVVLVAAAIGCLGALRSPEPGSGWGSGEQALCVAALVSVWMGTEFVRSAERLAESTAEG